MLGQRRYFDLIMISQNWRRADIGPMLGKMAFITSRQTVRKLMLGRCCFLDMNFISGNWRRADIWQMSEKMKFMTSRLMIRKLILGRRCYFDLIMISQNWRRADIWQMSEQVGKLSEYWCWANVVISTWLWYRKTDVGPMLGKMAFITVKSANCQKTDVGPMFFGPELWYREIDVGPTSDRCLKRWHS